VDHGTGEAPAQATFVEVFGHVNDVVVGAEEILGRGTTFDFDAAGDELLQAVKQTANPQTAIATMKFLIRMAQLPPIY
jgi:hypothetical protein